MKDTCSRAYAYTSVLMYCTIGLLISIFVSSYLTQNNNVKSSIAIDWVTPNGSFKMARFYPNLDLTKQFDFNTKQVFLFVVAKTKASDRMIWSKIVKNGDNYKFFDIVHSSGFEAQPGEKVKFLIGGNVFPYVGQLRIVHYGETEY